MLTQPTGKPGLGPQWGHSFDLREAFGKSTEPDSPAPKMPLMVREELNATPKLLHSETGQL